MSRTLLALASIMLGGATMAAPIGSLVDIIFIDSFDDVQAIQTTVGAVALGEAGSGTFGARLALQPPGNVSVSVASSDTGAATVSPAVLDFTSSDYAIFQPAISCGCRLRDVSISSNSEAPQIPNKADVLPVVRVDPSGSAEKGRE